MRNAGVRGGAQREREGWEVGRVREGEGVSKEEGRGKMRPLVCI